MDEADEKAAFDEAVRATEIQLRAAAGIAGRVLRIVPESVDRTLLAGVVQALATNFAAFTAANAAAAANKKAS